MKTALILLLATLALTGCNTIGGIGRDITGGAKRLGAML